MLPREESVRGKTKNAITANAGSLLHASPRWTVTATAAAHMIPRALAALAASEGPDVQAEIPGRERRCSDGDGERRGASPRLLRRPWMGRGNSRRTWRRPWSTAMATAADGAGSAGGFEGTGCPGGDARTGNAWAEGVAHCRDYCGGHGREEWRLAARLAATAERRGVPRKTWRPMFGAGPPPLFSVV